MLKEKINILFLKLGDYSKIFIVLVAIFLGISLYRNFSRVKDSQKRIGEARERVEELKRENERLARELREVESDEFIERELRNKLNMAKEDEIVVVLPEEEIVKKLAPDEEEEAEVLPPPNWKKWFNLFL